MSKPTLLSLLEAHRGELISGQELADTLGISRAAVSKGIKRLRSSGYHIDSFKGEGYLLSSLDDTLSAPAIQKHLQTVRLGRTLTLFECLPSTNTYLKELALNGTAVNGLTVIANKQTQGRGRFSRNFYSPGDTGIYMSCLLRPESLPIDRLPLITVAAATAVCSAIEKCTGISPSLKWVNDLYLNRKKLGGILTEAQMELENGQLSFAVVGIGLNIHPSDFPKEISEIATALTDLDAHADRNRIIASILNELEYCLELLLHDPEKLTEEYRSRIFHFGETVTVHRADGSFEVVAVDITEKGELIVMKDNEKIILNSGEVSIKL